MRWATTGLVLLATSLTGLGTIFPSVPKWAVVHAGVILAAVVALVYFLRGGRVNLGLPDLLLTLLIGWAGVSILWSPDVLQGQAQFFHILALGGAFLWFRHAGADIAFIGRGAIYIALAMVLVRPDFGGHGNENFLTELLIIGAVMAAGMKGKFYWIGWATALSALYYLVVFNDSKLEFMVLAALIAWRLARNDWRWVVGGAVGLSVLAYVFWSQTPESIIVRLDLWINTGRLILSAPFFGNGLGSFDYLYDALRDANSWLLGSSAVFPAGLYAGAAHNEFLQVWAETGIVGLALLCAFLWGIRWEYPLIAVGALAMVEFPMQNPASAILAVACLGAYSRPGTVSVGSRVLFFSPVMAGVCAVLGWSAWTNYRADMRMSDAYKNISVNAIVASAANIDAAQIFPYDRRYRLQLGLTVGRLLNDARAGKFKLDLGNEAADRVWAIASSAAPNQPAVLLHRISYLLEGPRWPEAGPLIDRLKRVVPRIPETWLAEAVYSLKVNDGNRAAEAVQKGMALNPLKEQKDQFLTIASHLYRS